MERDGMANAIYLCASYHSQIDSSLSIDGRPLWRDYTAQDLWAKKAEAEQRAKERQGQRLVQLSTRRFATEGETLAELYDLQTFPSIELPQPASSYNSEDALRLARRGSFSLFIGRDSERASLIHWLDDDEQQVKVKWQIISGPAGVGKSRLGDELARIALDSGWRGGRIRTGFTRWDRLDTSENTLLILDYCAEHLDTLVALIEAQAGASTTQMLRVLLIDREANREQGWFNELIQRLRPSAKQLFLSSQNQALTLAPLSEVDVQQLCTMTYRLIRPQSPVPRDLFDQVRHFDGRPLVVMLAVEAIANGGNARNWDLTAVTEHVLDSMFKRWRDLGVSEEALGWLDRAIVSGMDLAVPESALGDISGKAKLALAFEETQAVTLAHPLEPDVLAEAFIIHRFANRRLIAPGQQATLSNVKSRFDDLVSEFPSRFGILLGRIIQDFGEDGWRVATLIPEQNALQKEISNGFSVTAIPASLRRWASSFSSSLTTKGFARGLVGATTSEVTQLVAIAKQNALVLDHKAYSSLIARTNSLKEAMACFAEMKEAGLKADEITYNSLIVKSPDLAQARPFLAEMKEAGLTPNEITYNSLISKARDLSQARPFLAEMKKAELAPDEITYSSLIAKAPDLAQARLVLADMMEAGLTPNEITYNALISKAPDMAQARPLLAEMKEAGLTPDEFTYSSLIAKSPDMAQARLFLEEMKESGLTPDEIIYSSLIAKSPDLAQAWPFLAEMKQAGLTPDEITYSSLISRARDLAEARLVLADMKESGLTPNEITYSSLISKARDLAEARLVLVEMKEARLKPNEFTFRNMLRHCRQFDEAVDIICDFEPMGLKPDSWAWNVLLSLVPEAQVLNVLNVMAEAGDVVNSHHVRKLENRFRQKPIWAEIEAFLRTNT
jgi:Pentatricopeptide repeat domain